MLAEQYAMQGGKIIPFGKPDPRIAAYLSESIADFHYNRCLVIGDCMATDMRMGNSVKAQTLLITSGVLQLKNPGDQQINELSQNYGLSIDYYMENLQW
jgi:ribonucleotide monophosphatase NagD (HAD superfamily)